MELKISQDLAQAILNYLGTRPYVDVFQLVQGVQALQTLDGKVAATPVQEVAPVEEVTEGVVENPEVPTS